MARMKDHGFLTPMPLEDDVTDVLRKALRGHDLSPSAAAQHAGLPERVVMGLLRGHEDSAALGNLAPVLGLNPTALIQHHHYTPKPIVLDGLQALVLPFHGGTVNAWLLEKGGTIILIDTGESIHGCSDELQKRNCNGVHVLITHGHGDHIGGLEGLYGRMLSQSGPSSLHSLSPLSPGDTFTNGPFSIKVIDLDGHWHGALGYLIHGLEKPVFAVGDALFAGSIGGCPDPERYQAALRTLHAALASLPHETVLLPGHGPVTTWSEERQSNPFPIFPAGVS